MADNKVDEKEIYVGAVVEINKNRINLIPSTPINKIDERGLKLSLDKPVELGKFGAAMDSICQDIGIEKSPLDRLKDTNSDLLKGVTKKVENANMRIEALQYEQPPAAQQAPTKYIFVASVNWTDDKASDKTDFFKLKGLIFGVSSGFTNGETGDNPEIQKAFRSALQAMTPVAALAPAPDTLPESQNSETQQPKVSKQEAAAE